MKKHHSSVCMCVCVCGGGVGGGGGAGGGRAVKFTWNGLTE